MSHLNILNISREIENINKNISTFHNQINDIEEKNNLYDVNPKIVEELTRILSLLRPFGWGSIPSVFFKESQKIFGETNPIASCYI